MTPDLERAAALAAGEMPDAAERLRKSRYLVTITTLRPITAEEYAAALRRLDGVVDCKVEEVGH